MTPVTTMTDQTTSENAIKRKRRRRRKSQKRIKTNMWMMRREDGVRLVHRRTLSLVNLRFVTL